MTRAVLLAAAAAAAMACGDSLGDGGDWRRAEAMQGDLRPEVEGQMVSGELRGSAVRVVTFNVEFGADWGGIADALIGSEDLSRADVFLIQEIESHPGEGRSRAAALAGALTMNYAYAPARSEGAGTHGLAIISRFSLGAVEVMPLPRAETRIRARDRIAMRALLDVAGEELWVVNVHLDVRLGIAERVEQLHPVTLSASERVVIGGDFNTNPYAWAGPVPLLPDQAAADLDQADTLDDYMRAFGFETPTSSSGSTQDAVVEMLRLDSIYTRDLQPLATDVERDVQVSDHRPLWLDLEWPP